MERITSIPRHCLFVDQMGEMNKEGRWPETALKEQSHLKQVLAQNKPKPKIKISCIDEFIPYML